jgi:hypothetical protein
MCVTGAFGLKCIEALRSSSSGGTSTIVEVRRLPGYAFHSLGTLKKCPSFLA